MKMRKLIFFIVLTLGFTLQSYGQTCKDLYKDAKELLDAGKLEKAKVKYQQVVACGDNFYVPDSKERIKWIDRILHKPDKTKSFSISENEITIPYQGGQDVVTIDGNGTWTAIVDASGKEWCKIRKTKGKVYIQSEANESNEERICEIVISMGGRSKKVTVKNERAPEFLVPAVENVTFTSKGETNTVGIHANTEWNITEAPGWVVTNKEDGKITLTAQPNDNNKERQADIKIESTSKAVIINIYQGAGLDNLAFSKNDLHFGPDGGDEYINVYTDADDWRFGDFPHWCQVTRVADNLIKVHCTPNDPVNLNREASVNVTTGKQTLGIHVSQEAKPFVSVIPNIGIGGRAVSFGLSVGYLYPMINASSGGNFTGSPVNYALGNNGEEVSYSSAGGFSIGVHSDIRIYKNFYIQPGLNFLHYAYKNEFDQTYERKVATYELGYYTKGTVHSKYKENYKMNTLELQVLASYRIPVSRGSHLQFNVGPTLGYGINATMKIDGGYDGENIGAYYQQNDLPMGNTTGSVHFVGSGELDLYGKEVKYSEANVIGSTDVSIPYDAQLEDSPFKRLNWGAKAGVTYEYAGISIGIEYSIMLSNMANKKFWDSDRWMIFRHNAYSAMTGYKQHNNYLQIKLGYTFRY